MTAEPSTGPSAGAPIGSDAPEERNTVVLMVVGALALISVVIAALVIYTTGKAPARQPAQTASVRVEGQALVLGRPGAKATVVVHEDFGSPESRAFEIASRDFLRIEAARGVARVEYRPFPHGASPYATDGMRLFAAALSTGTPHQALAVHDLLFDRQPATGAEPPVPTQLAAWAKEKGLDEGKVIAAMGSSQDELAAAGKAAADAGVRRTPLVVLDGRPLTAASPTALADTLQRRLLRLEGHAGASG